MVQSRGLLRFNLFIILSIVCCLIAPASSYSEGKFDNPRATNMFPQPSDNSGFTLRDKGVINSNQRYSYKYEYGQKNSGPIMVLM